MIKTTSKTLREFSLRVVDKTGTKYTIRFGYDTSGKHSGHVVSVSINNGKFSSAKSELAKLNKLGITAINQLIDAMNRDVTGTPYNYNKTSEELIIGLINNESSPKVWKRVLDFYKITDITGEEQIAEFIGKYIATKSPEARTGLLQKFNATRRIVFINHEKNLIKAIRKLYMKGVVINGKHYLPVMEGMLKKTSYSDYYKRDIDYVRKARVRVFTKILNKNYIPYQN